MGRLLGLSLKSIYIKCMMAKYREDLFWNCLNRDTSDYMVTLGLEPSKIPNASLNVRNRQHQKEPLIYHSQSTTISIIP